MENPISYSDLFNPELQNDIQGLINKVKEVEKSLTDMIGNVKSQAKGLGDALSTTSSSTKGGRDASKEQADQVAKLYQAYMSLGEAYKYVEYNLTALQKSQDRVNKAIKLGQTAANEEEGSIERLKAQIELAKMAYESMDKQTRDNTSDGKRLLTVIQSLTGQVKNYEKAMKGAATAETRATTAHKQAKVETLDLSKSYSTLSGLITQTGVNLQSLVTSQKAQEQASKNGVIANNSLNGSYNQLYAQYNLIKIALNNMSKEMRDNVNVGKVWEAEALRIMNEMKAMQEATGKSTLSVGDYGKALNGLNISTQQVLREMPTLANSVSQFFIAISNNVPIFVDNFKRAQAELGGFTKAVGATLKAVLSWQTVLLVLLTVLPKVAKAIHDKKKAQEEANKETEKAVSLTELLAEAEKAVGKATIDATNKLKVLTSIIKDNNRSWEDRVKAAQIMKKEWEDEFANFSEEEILLGKAKIAIDQLTNSLVIQAQAKAVLNEIGNLSVKLYELEIDRADARAKQMAEEAKMTELLAEKEALQARSISDVQMYGQTTQATANAIVANTKAIKDQSDAIEEAGASFRKTDMAMQDTENAIDALKKKINVEGLFDLDNDNGPRSLREKIMQIPSYYNDALRAIIDGMDEGLQKEIAMLDLEYKIAIEKRHEQEMALLEMMETAKGEQVKILQDELSNLRFTMSAEEYNYYQTRERMMREHIAAMTKAEVLMDDPEQEALQNLKDTLKVEKRYRDLMAAQNWERNMNELNQKEHFAYEEVALKDELNAQLLDSERKYWEDYLIMLKANGLELTDEYMEVVNKLAGYAESSSSTTKGGRKKRGRKNYRNLTEVAFAFTGVTGEQAGPGALNRKIKDDYLDFADAVNNALQTSIDYMEEWMDKRIEMAEIAVEQAEKEANAAKTALDYEQQARANGYANNVELARKEYEEKLALQQQAVAEQKRLQKIQDSINTAQQISSLVTATANLWSAYSGIPMVGPALAIAATALMWGSFLAAKVQAANVAGTVTHGEGMAEYLNYGGSHASGNDIDFGHTRDGRRRRVERGEVVGVIKKDSVEKYGANTVLNVIKSLNGGTFEKNYTTQNYLSTTDLLSMVFGGSTVNNSVSNRSKMAQIVSNSSTDLLSMVLGGSTSIANSVATKEKLMQIINNTSTSRNYGYGQIRGISKDVEANYAMAFNGGGTDLSAIERGIHELIHQNDVRVVQTPYGRIEYRGNTKRIIKDA